MKYRLEKQIRRPNSPVCETTVQIKDVAFEQVIDLLRVTPLCDGLNNEELAVLAGKLEVRSFQAGETLAAPGDPVTEFWVVAEGEIEAYLTDARGRESQIGVARKGETIGEIAIMENALRPIRFTAQTDGTLLTISSHTFLEWVEAFPPLMKNLFRAMSIRFRRAVGITERKLPSPRLGIVASTPRGQLLVGRLMNRLLAAGEGLQVWTENPSQLRETWAWPKSLSIEPFPANEQPWLEPPTSGIDRRILVWSPSADVQLDVGRLLCCDEILWLMEPRRRLLQVITFASVPNRSPTFWEKCVSSG